MQGLWLLSDTLNRAMLFLPLGDGRIVLGRILLGLAWGWISNHGLEYHFDEALPPKLAGIFLID